MRRPPSRGSPASPSRCTCPKRCATPSCARARARPCKLHPDDFEVEEYESTRRSATVFAIDLSLSMAMRGNLVPAKKMVLALTQLIRSKFPRDFVAVVGFGEMAQELKIEDIPALTIDYAYGTNLQHALALSRHLMRDERGERQIVVVTDGEPTAHLMDNGEPFFSWPPVHETLERTMAEVLALHQGGHHHQHLRPRYRAQPVPVRRTDRQGQRRPDFLHLGRRTGQSTRSTTSCAAAARASRFTQSAPIRNFNNFHLLFVRIPVTMTPL